jgi:putative ABC transport system permease protein
MLHDLRYGMRTLLRAPGFATLVTLILALGVGANSAVFSIVNAVLLRPLPFHDPDHLYQLDEVNGKGQISGVPPVDLEAFRQFSNAIDRSASNRWFNATLTGPEGAENIFGVRVSSELFPMLGVAPALGRTFRPDEFRPGAPGAVVLSDRLWKRRFERNPAAIGAQLMLNGQAYTIAGVMPADFYFPQRYEFWIPWQLTAAEAGKRDERWPAMVRLKNGVTPAQAQTAIAAIYRNAAPEDARKGWTIRLNRLHDQITGRSRPALLMVLGAVGFVLLIACFNIANLLLARGSNRNREMAIRAALGAGRFRVFRQLLTESVLLAAVGGALGTAFGALGARALALSFPERLGMPRVDQTRLDWRVLLFTFGISVLTGIAFGVIPACNAARAGVNITLKESGRGGGSRSQRLRNLLVVSETALSLMLLAGAGLMLRSFSRLLAQDPGFNAEHVLTVRVPLPANMLSNPAPAAYYTRLLEQVRSVPGLNAAGMIAPLPLAGVDANADLTVEGRPSREGEQQLVKLRSVSPGYFRAMGLTLRQGRVFDESDGPDAPQSAVVSESLARRYFPNENPIGKRIAMSRKGPWLPIVGVVKDIKSLDLAGKSEPELYRDYRQFFFAPFANTIVVRTQSADPASVAAAIQRRIRAANPDQPMMDLQPMPKVVADSVAQPRFGAFLLAIFAGIALLLAAAGLYGVLSYSVSQRVREIGIRLALGASRELILRDIVGHAMLLLGTGAAAGLAGALVLTRLLSAQLFEIGPADPLTYASVTLILAVVGLTAAYLPARRATQIDPNKALRAD